MSIEKYISPFVQSQFPQLYREYGPNFIAFVRAYYEWLENTGNPLNQARSLYEYGDIDETLDTFVKYFKNKYMLSIPQTLATDKILLVKHILDLYRSKGSLRAYELLFRILFNEDIKVYIPGDDLFRLSNNQFVKPVYLEVSQSIYLNDIVGKTIVDSTSMASAVVENYSKKLVNNKTINVLTLSAVEGSFKYGHRILCDDLYINSKGSKISKYEFDQLSSAEKTTYSLAIDISNAPYILGSLSSVGIINGGANFAVGDLINVQNEGKGGVARVASVRDENGKVTFTLVDGGSGYSVNAVVSVVGGNGSGATFKIGNLTDIELFRINTDVINDFYNTQLEVTGDGCNLEITGVSGTFYSGDTINSVANTVTRCLGITPIFNNALANGENVSNTSLGINNLTAYRVDGSLIYVHGSDITNANLTSGVVLISNTSGTVIRINSVTPTQNTYGSGTATFVNSSVITVTGDFGYYVPSFSVTSTNTGATATVTSLSRNTSWAFSAPTSEKKNLDEKIGLALTTFDLEVGTITYLSQINPGQGYASDPIVTITEPLIYDLRIPDKSGYKGKNSVVTAKAGTSKGIVNAVEIYDSGFGYSPGSYILMSSSNTENQTVVTGRAVVDTQGVGAGYFTSRSGFLSDTQHVIDSKYWQTQSYDIVAQRMLKFYEKFVRDLVHPSGIALFGSYRILSEINNEQASPESFSLASS